MTVVVAVCLFSGGIRRIKIVHGIDIYKEETIKMSVQVENLEKNMAKLTIEVSAEDLEKALESAYQKQKKQISVPGFRK